MPALDRLLNLHQTDGTAISLVPWFVRGIEDSGTGAGSLVILADHDAFEVTEDRETVAAKLLAVNQTPIETESAP